jgi:hypothetical protein
MHTTLFHFKYETLLPGDLAKLPQEFGSLHRLSLLQATDKVICMRLHPVYTSVHPLNRPEAVAGLACKLWWAS